MDEFIDKTELNKKLAYLQIFKMFDRGTNCLGRTFFRNMGVLPLLSLFRCK